MSEDFKEEGSVVELKSGGPRMTVEGKFSRADGSTRVSCLWFDDDLKLCRGDFSPAALQSA